MHDELPLSLRIAGNPSLSGAELTALSRAVKAAGLSSRKLAALAGVSTFSAQQAIRGTWCGIGVAQKIATALGLDLFEVVAGGQGPYCVKDARGDLWNIERIGQ